MKTAFKLVVMMVITSLSAFAQNSPILSKQLIATDKTELSLDIRNAFVQLETSPDEHIYIDYAIDFKNYRTGEIKSILKGITTDVIQNGDAYVLKIDSKTKMSSKVYNLESDFGISLDKVMPTPELTYRKFKKSKESLFGKFLWDESKAEVVLEMFRKFKVDGTTEKVDLDKVKLYNVKFVIKVPQQMKLNLKLKQSEVRFNYASENKINCDAENSTIRSLGFTNQLSSFKMNNGRFKAHHTSGGKYAFKNLNSIIIGALDNVVIDSEFSDFSIGEVGENTKINDFNSQFWLYDFNSEMGEYIMNTEYSKINVYYPENTSNFLMITKGYATVHYVDNTIFETPPSKQNKPVKMLVYGNDTPSVLNKVSINTINGIIRLGKDFIDILD
ncbi:hypothetical protein [Psychroserpens ponticola]|uniref:Uncharacterized protein n=1 Tax=Psychroserpens ponticola TaxID=2932268 RepID=A0ABY7RUI2_9FLAO|nr:hypothetical protein [Psychroserpens ponticola]WCO00759.1 hypothetical protein MUN68_011845 [Psychroserpens ponticola]